MLILGCGTSWFVAQCIAELRESAGLGETEVTMQRTVLPPRVDDPGPDAADEGGGAPASPTG